MLITGFISIIFGTLPVGAGLYPWWGAWLIMPVLLILIFVVFSSGHRENSRSLFKIGYAIIIIIMYIQLNLSLCLLRATLRYSHIRA